MIWSDRPPLARLDIPSGTPAAQVATATNEDGSWRNWLVAKASYRPLQHYPYPYP